MDEWHKECLPTDEEIADQFQIRQDEEYIYRKPVWRLLRDVAKWCKNFKREEPKKESEDKMGQRQLICCCCGKDLTILTYHADINFRYFCDNCWNFINSLLEINDDVNKQFLIGYKRKSIGKDYLFCLITAKDIRQAFGKLKERFPDVTEKFEANIE